MNRGQTFYHFTCSDHGYPGITRDKYIKPNPHPLLRLLGPVVWLTNNPTPDSEALGLTSDNLSCDRTEWRFEVHTKAAKPWSELKHKAGPQIVEILESYGKPETWYIVRRPLLTSEIGSPEKVER